MATGDIKANGILNDKKLKTTFLSEIKKLDQADNRNADDGSIFKSDELKKNYQTLTNTIKANGDTGKIDELTDKFIIDIFKADASDNQAVDSSIFTTKTPKDLLKPLTPKSNKEIKDFAKKADKLDDGTINGSALKDNALTNLLGMLTDSKRNGNITETLKKAYEQKNINTNQTPATNYSQTAQKTLAETILLARLAESLPPAQRANYANLIKQKLELLKNSPEIQKNPVDMQRIADIEQSATSLNGIQGTPRPIPGIGYGSNLLQQIDYKIAELKRMCGRSYPPPVSNSINVNAPTGTAPNSNYSPVQSVPNANAKADAVYNKHGKDIQGRQLKLSAGQQQDLEGFKKCWNNPENRKRYDAVAAKTGMPAKLVAALHWRESNGDFGTYLHQGDPLGKPAVHVPSDIPVFQKWEDAAIHALGQKKSIQSEYGLTADSKDMSGMLAYAEKYNGLGYHNKNRVSPYIYSGMDNYTGGKYVADGEFSASAVDSQIGVMAMLVS